MSDEARKPMPPQPTTVSLDKPPSWAIALSEKMATSLQRIDAKLAGIETNQDLQGVVVKDLATRVTSLTERTDTLERRASKGSERVTHESEVNLKQEAAIATVIMEQAEAKKRDERTQAMLIAAQAAITQNTALTTEINTAVLRASKHPAVQALLLAAITFITAWLSRHA